MYTELSTAETGLWKTLYTKNIPSSEVVPEKRKHRDHKKGGKDESGPVAKHLWVADRVLNATG